MSTPLLPFAFWSSGTNQNSIPANDNSRRNQILNGKVISQAIAAQPGSPAEGDIYIIAASPTGAQWAGFTAKDVAIYSSGTWYAFAPVEGVVVNVAGALYKYDSGAWAAVAAGGGSIAGADKQIQYNNGGAFGAEAGFEYDQSSNTFSAPKAVLSAALNEAKAADIASAGTTDIGAATGNLVHVTGTTTITALGTVQAGTRRIVVFDGALTLTHNATSLILPTGASITTAAGDTAVCVSEGSGNWRVTSYYRKNGTALAVTAGGSAHAIPIACSDETTALTTGVAKVTFRMPFAMTLTAVRASVTTAPTGAVLTVDINEGGVSILSTKITIDATEKTSTTAAAAPVISDAALADDAEITIDIDTVGSTVAGTGLKVYLIGTV